MLNYEFSIKLFDKEINISLHESDNQKNKFTNDHLRCDGRIEIGNEQTGYSFFTFDYQFNPKFFEPEAKDILKALLMDAYSYESTRDIDDFFNEFGYTKVSKALRDYEACKKVSEYFRDVFSESELEELSEIQDNNWEIIDERE